MLQKHQTKLEGLEEFILQGIGQVASSRTKAELMMSRAGLRLSRNQE